MYTVKNLPEDTGPSSYANIARTAIINANAAKSEIAKISQLIKLEEIASVDDLLSVQRDYDMVVSKYKSVK